jgi:hypothetical protein
MTGVPAGGRLKALRAEFRDTGTIQNSLPFFGKSDFGVVLYLRLRFIRSGMRVQRSLVENTQRTERLSYRCDMRRIARNFSRPLRGLTCFGLLSRR